MSRHAPSGERATKSPHRATGPAPPERVDGEAPERAAPSSEPARLLALQRAAGNRAVAELIGDRGVPLDPVTQCAMESSFGQSFADVRVHADDVGDAAARKTDALALTIGRDIAFREGEYQPDTLPGRQMIAHELTHVVQQRNAPVEISDVEPQGSAAEREADATAGDVTAGRTAKPVTAAARGITRDVGFARRGEISDPHGMGYNEIYNKAGPDSKGAVLALSSLETPRMFVDLDKYKQLEASVRKSILALEPHAAGTACAGWFDLMRANDPDFTPKLTPEQTRAAEAAYRSSTREAALQRRVDAAKAELPKMDAAAVDAKWKDNKYGLVTVAQSKNHGIKAETLHRIWIKYWDDKFKAAEQTRDTIVKRESEADSRAYFRKINEYENGDRKALGPDYDRARADIALGELMFRHSAHAIEVCRFADAEGKSLTLDELTDSVIEWAKIYDPMVQAIEQYLVFGRGGPAPSRSKPSKGETNKPQPPASKPADTQAKPEQGKSRPATPPAGETKAPEGAKPSVGKEPEVGKSPEAKAPEPKKPPEGTKEPEASKGPETTKKPEAGKEPDPTREPAPTKPAQPDKEPESKKDTPKPAEKPAEGTKEQPTPPPEKAPAAANPQTRLQEIKNERAEIDAEIRDKHEKRAAAQQRARDAAAKIPNAPEAEKPDLRDKRDRNQATADRLKDEIDRARIRNNKLAEEQAALEPGVSKPQTWQEAESALRKEFSGQKKEFVLAGGNREVDCFSPDGVAREGKFGPQSLNPQIQAEIGKDAALMKSGAVKGVEWHFYENPQTGIGPSGPLKNALTNAGFKIVIH